MEDDGTVKEATGQDALAIGWDHHRAVITHRRQYLINPDTFACRGNRVLDYGLAYGGLLQSTTLINGGFVNEIGQIP